MVNEHRAANFANGSLGGRRQANLRFEGDLLQLCCEEEGQATRRCLAKHRIGGLFLRLGNAVLFWHSGDLLLSRGSHLRREKCGSALQEDGPSYEVLVVGCAFGTTTLSRVLDHRGAGKRHR